MKKLAVLLVLLAVALPLVAKDLTVSDAFWVFGKYDFSPTRATPKGPVADASSFVRARIGWDFKVDDFNSVFFQFKGDGTVGSTLDITESTATPPADQDQINWRQAYLKTDIGAALKVPMVGIKATVGYFDTYFTNWSYVSMSGWEFYYDWPNQLVNYGQDKNAAAQFDITLPPLGPAAVGLHWYNDFLWTNIAVGADVAVGPVTAYVAFGGATADLNDGNLSVEAKYSGKVGPVSLAVPAFFRYNLDPGESAAKYTWGAGVGADISMFHVAAGLEGDNKKAMDNIVIDVTVAPMEGLKACVSAYMDMKATGNDSVFSGVVTEVRKKLGALEAVLGWVFDMGGNGLPTYGDNFTVKNGLFGGFVIDY